MLLDNTIHWFAHHRSKLTLLTFSMLQCGRHHFYNYILCNYYGNIGNSIMAKPLLEEDRDI